MKAAVSPRYGTPDVLAVREVPMPVPGDTQVRVAVHAAAVGRTDAGMLRPHPPLLGRLMAGLFRPPPILGMDFAGVVDSAGKDVRLYKPGDRVFGMLRLREVGAHAEYVCVPENGYVAKMPEALPFHEAVLCEGALYAKGCLDRLGLKAGDSVLIYGASGAIGTAAVQLARAAGARVTAVVDTRHVELARGLGAERVIDYTQEDFTRIGERFDGLIDAVGKTTYLRCRRLLKPKAMFVGTDLGPYGQILLLTLWRGLTGRGRVTVGIPRHQPDFVDRLKALMEAGRFRAVIDRRYPLTAIADAYRYVETGQKTGIVVIDVA